MKHILHLIFIVIFINHHFTEAQNYGSWTSVDSLNLDRAYSASILLPNGNVLVTGGEGGNPAEITNTCELYDYKANTWTYTANMNIQRFYHQMVQIDSNRVLVIGGYREKSCEIYNIKENTWSITDSLKQGRLFGFTTTLLNNGKVIIVGGLYQSEDLTTRYYLKDVELFDPTQEKWQKTDSLIIAKSYHTSTLLKDGRLLVAGGSGAGRECELFDPAIEKWEVADSLNQERDMSSAVLLDNGNVLVSGGDDYSNLTNPWLNSCELYNYLENKWELVTSMYSARDNHSSIMLTNGLILFTGGNFGTETWELYDPNTFTNIYYGSYPVSQFLSNIVKLSNGNVVSIGGWTVKGSELPVISTTPMCELYSTLTGIEKTNLIGPNTIYLFQNFPNPFNPTTKICYTIDQPGFVKLMIFDITGKLLEVLVNEEKGAGTFDVFFDAKNYSSGIYFYQLQSSGKTLTKKMVLIH